MLNRRSLLCVLILGLGVPRHVMADGPGILLLAHGGNAEWNAHVMTLVARTDRTYPTEVAFGMATRANIQAAVDRLQQRGVTSIVAVPLFVSSWSSVMTSTEYLLGQRAIAPPELAIFAKMSHPTSAGTSTTTTSGTRPVGGAHAHQTPDPTSPVDSSVPVRMTSALNDHPVVAEILASRARSISRNTTNEAVIVVAHGPTKDDENRRWLTDMASLAERVRRLETFASVDYLTLRDDAPKPIRDQATAELRATVTKRLDEGRRVLIVPLLVAFGGIERGLRARLEGLPYAMPDQALVPDERLVTWVLEMAADR